MADDDYNYEEFEDFEEEYDPELMRAAGLMQKAEKIARGGNIKGAISIYSKSLNIFIYAGKYMRVVDLFNQIVSFIQLESHILPIMEKLRGTILSIEQLNIPEEEAKLKLALANLSYKSSDYLAAGNTFIEVSELLYKVDPEFYRKESGMYLIRAGECFEKIRRGERAELLILNAISRFDMSNFELKTVKKAVTTAIQKKKYETAITHLREIAQFFRKLEKALENLPEDEITFRNLKSNVQARILHMISEYNLIKMVCFRKLGKEELVIEQAEKSILDLIHAIDAMKDELKERFYSSADLHRLTFDLFMLQFFQEFADYQVEDPLDLVLRGLPNSIKKIVTKMKFYEFTLQILEFGLMENIDIFKKMPLSLILNPFRDIISDAIE